MFASAYSLKNYPTVETNKTCTVKPDVNQMFSLDYGMTAQDNSLSMPILEPVDVNEAVNAPGEYLHVICTKGTRSDIFTFNIC